MEIVYGVYARGVELVPEMIPVVSLNERLEGKLGEIEKVPDETPGARINVGVKVALLPVWNPMATGVADAPEEAVYE
jgi:hypothetical protein